MQSSLSTIREVLSHFISEVTDGYKIDEKALSLTPVAELRAAVVSELRQSSLKNHMEYLESKDQFTMACYVAADFTSSHPLKYQVMVAQLTIFFFHAEDVLKEKPELLRQLQLNVATS